MKQAKRFGFIFGILFLLVAALAFAASPFIVQSGGQLTIEAPKLPYYQTGDYDFYAYTHVFNSSGASMTNATTNCTLHIYNRSAAQIFDGNSKYIADDFYWILPRNITNVPDTYAFIVYCENSEEGFTSGTFTMGYTDTDPLFYLGGMAGVIALIFIILNVGFKLDATHAPIKMFLIWLSFGLVVILCNLLQQVAIVTLMPGLMISIFTNLFIISVILATIVSFYFMLYFMQMLLKFLQGTAAGKKWWSRKDDKDRS